MNQVTVLSPKTRLFELDALRGIAIIMVVFSHIWGYLYNPGPSEVFNPYMGTIGLAIFFFISGYSLYLNNSLIKSRGDIVKFYKKRVGKIFPLYWIAVLASVLAFGILGLRTDGAMAYNFGWVSAIIHAVGLQGFLGYNMPSLWFISAILLYYALYPFLVYLSGNLRRTATFWFITLLLIGAADIPLRSMNFGLFLYYSVFVGGVMAGMIGLFDERRQNLLPAFALLLPLSLIFEEKLFDGGNYSVLGFTIPNLISILAFSVTRDCMAISVSVVLYWVFKSYAAYFTRIKGVLTAISYGSFATFLFHIILYAAFWSVLDILTIRGTYADACMYLIAFPMTFVLGYLIQGSFDALMKIRKGWRIQVNINWINTN